jgi:dipeptidyl-peptidase-4
LREIASLRVSLTIVATLIGALVASLPAPARSQTDAQQDSALARSTLELPAEARAELERIIETRGFTRGLPTKPMPSPDGKRVYFLRSGPTDRFQSLYVFDVKSGRTKLLISGDGLGAAGDISKEEQARRERMRETERGITSFTISEDGERILIPYSGDIFIADAITGASKQLTKTDTAEIDPHLSPDGKWVAFVQDGDLRVLDVESGALRIIAMGQREDREYGVAEHIAQEEMDRLTGHWWSPDSRRLAFAEVETRNVPRFRVPDFNDPTGEGSATPYPKAGDRNAVVRLGVVDVLEVAVAERGTWGGGSSAGEIDPNVSWLDLGDFEYLARVEWSLDSRSLWVQTQPRSQEKLELKKATFNEVATVLAEEDPDWVNLHDTFRWLDGGERLLWSSERTGHRHLEVVRADGTRERTLTSGEWDVMSVVHVDEKRGDVTFVGTKDGVVERHLYRVSLDGGDVTKLTSEPGWHGAAFNRFGNDLYVESWEDDKTQAKQRVRRRDGKLVGELPSEAMVPSAEEIGPESQIVRTRTDLGLELAIRVTSPENRLPGQTRPLIVYVYGGPGAQQVGQRWPGERGLVDAWLARRGFVTARIDGRGVVGRGHDSERLYSGRMGEVELQDQLVGVRTLFKSFPEIDSTRVGIWGWSYGGYMTLMAMFRAGGVFDAGVSIAPVVDWRGYDTHYTERYLGLPSENAEGYDASSTLTYADGLKGHLTLVHGTGDDNVHFRESMLLVNKLVESGKDFDLMVYPGTHMMESTEERMHLYTLLWRTFVEELRRRPQ